MMCSIKGKISQQHIVAGHLKPGANGVSKYEQLPDKPQINSVELVGNKTFEDLGLVEISNQEILDIAKKILFTEGV